jgi:hypothetical protein
LAIDECGSIHSFALMAKPNRYASLNGRQVETSGQLQRGISASAKRFLLQACEEHLMAGKSLNKDIDGAAGAVLKAKGLI